MKKFFKGVGNFFKKIGLFIWKYLKISFNYVKDNAWLQPIVLVVLIFALVFGFQGVVNGIEKYKENKAAKQEESKNQYTKLTMAQARQKMADKEDFVLFIGAASCVYCAEFKTVVNKYVSSTGNAIYYIDIEDDSDTSMEKRYLDEWVEKLTKIETRMLTGLSTPTVIVIRDGEFADAKSGAQGLSGGMEYLNFVDFVEGKYIGKIEEPTTDNAESK